MGKIFNVVSNYQQEGTTAGEINKYGQPKSANFWNKPINKNFVLPLIVFIISGIAVFYFTKPNPNMSDNVFHVTSNNQQGGLTVGQLNVGVPPRHLTDEIKKQLGSIPNKKIKILVINGNAEANQYAIEIKTFLESKGWQVDPNFGFLMMPASGIDIRENNELITIIVGSAS